MGGRVSNKNLIVLNWKCRLFYNKRRLKIFSFFSNSNDWNMALILMICSWNIDEKKATFSTTPSPFWLKPKQNNTFATIGLNLIWNHSELEYAILKNIFWHSLILGEVRGSNSKMNSAANFKISQQVSLNGILRFIWNQIWSNWSIFRPFRGILKSESCFKWKCTLYCWYNMIKIVSKIWFGQGGQGS